MKTPKHTPLSKLRHHVTGAIERGEAKPIESIVTPKHTKGPWKVIKATHDGEVISVADSSHAVDIQLVNNSNGPENWKNAHLIAAAPELLENFEKAIKLIEHMQDKFGYCVAVTISDGEKLIKKARGES